MEIAHEWYLHALKESGTEWNIESGFFKKTSVNRNFELKVFENVQNKNIKLPVYLSAGQETISASLSEICKLKKIRPLLFPQHRCHSIYISFGGNIKKLIHSTEWWSLKYIPKIIKIEKINQYKLLALPKTNNLKKLK